jgi:hypothetical protein
MEGIDTKLSKFINIGFIVTLVASPILTTSTTVSAAQNNLESVANTFEETNESITNCLWQDKPTYNCSAKVHNSASSLGQKKKPLRAS